MAAEKPGRLPGTVCSPRITRAVLSVAAIAASQLPKSRQLPTRSCAANPILSKQGAQRPRTNDAGYCICRRYEYGLTAPPPPGWISKWRCGEPP
jgi:hypothetical protein